MIDTTELVPVSIIQTELQKENITEQVIKDLRTNYLPLVIDGIEDKKGYALVDEARKNCKSLRVLASKICKKGREESIKIQKAWIAAENNVTSQIEEVENHLQKEQDRIDAEKKRIEEEKLQKEQERLRLRVALLIDNGCVFDGVCYSISPSLEIETNAMRLMSDETFGEFLTSVKIEHEKLLEAERETERLRVEAQKEEERKRQEEADKLKTEREELAKLRRGQEEREEKARAEQRRIADEQAAKERELQAKQDAITAQENEAKAKRIREEQEKQRELELQQAREDAAESARLQAIIDARIETETKAKQEEEAKAEAARQDALRPDKDKLLALSNTIVTISLPELSTDDGRLILEEVKTLLNKIQKHIVNKVKSL